MREAHNDYLQLAAEGGLLAGIPIVLAIAVLAYGIRQRFRSDVGSIWWVRAGAVTGLVAIAAQSFVEFSLQMPGNAALFAVLCGLALHDGGRSVTQRQAVAAPMPSAEPALPPQPRSLKVIPFSAPQRQLEFSSDASHDTAAVGREFDPSDLDDAEVPYLPSPHRARRSPARSNRPASAPDRTVGLTAVLALVFFVFVVIRLFGG